MAVARREDLHAQMVKPNANAPDGIRYLHGPIQGEAGSLVLPVLVRQTCSQFIIHDSLQWELFLCYSLTGFRRHIGIDGESCPHKSILVCASLWQNINLSNSHC